ncbi:phosphotransferase [Nocardiopsis sp. MG754419]|uniref:phosphotransferase n=1 Tax=Nocardiopsis sp. MG754419 TaxID=2259865 RepID=UPI001BAD71A2|nr:phosphotransferase [Nocardiopsis sp. MG754419]MBR8744805.1 aminoglycoside phosphotransferase family protein [Nocardiopsis sp. MG754419]
MSTDRDRPLSGGMMNTVTRRGDRVVRTAPDHAPALHSFLTRLSRTGFTGAPRPLALHSDGHEELTFVEGDVALPPFPAWALRDKTLIEVAGLLRRYHEAAATVPFSSDASWPTALGDPGGGTVLCHNDPCLENVVFRDGHAVALIDFDLAAPGRPVWDLAALAFYLGPTLDPASAAESGFEGLDAPRRLRLLADAYDMSAADREILPATVREYNEISRAFVRGMVERGDPLFVRALERLGGWARWDRRRAWLCAQEPVFLRALLD